MLNHKREIEQILSLSAQRIEQEQSDSGSFSSWSAPNEDFSSPLIYHTTFFTSQILACLSIGDRAEIAPILQRGSAFLQTQKSPHWSFNYWQRSSVEFSNLPYPDDLDDTFCALGALASVDNALISGTVLAEAVTLLTALEVQPGGPYRTWLTSKEAPDVWQDIDLAVNCNIAWFLGQQGVLLPKLTHLFEQHINSADYHSPYYPTEYPVIYFLSRAYAGKARQEIVSYLLSRQDSDGGWGSALFTTLATTVLLRYDAPHKSVEQAVVNLLKAWHSGQWTAAPFCFDPAIAGQPYFAGSLALTAAFGYEALSLYLQKQATPKVPARSQLGGQRIYQAVVTAIQQRFKNLPPTLHSPATTLLQTTLQKDKDQQIGLLPYWFANACGSLELNDRREMIAIDLGVANMYGWMAYTIYDNIIDETKDIDLLPLANICLREVVQTYRQQTKAEFWPLYQKTLDQQEAANWWEIKYARTQRAELPDYGNYAILADKSFGHALGPLAILSESGYSVDATETTITSELFRHYLIARQLNDDAHDWQTDLHKGQINSVATLVLQQWGGEIEKWSETLPQLQDLFWHHTIHDISRLILHHTQQVRELRQQLAFMQDDTFLENMIQPLEQAAVKAVEQSTKARDFLANYKGS